MIFADAQHPIPARRPREQAAPALFRLLAESALYRSVFSACGVALGIVDARTPRPIFVQVNRAFERNLGFHESEATRYSVTTLLLNGDLALERRLFGDAASHADVGIKRRDGSVAAMRVSADPLRDSDGQLTHWVLTFAEPPEATHNRTLREAFTAAAEAVRI